MVLSSTELYRSRLPQPSSILAIEKRTWRTAGIKPAARTAGIKPAARLGLRFVFDLVRGNRYAQHRSVDLRVGDRRWSQAVRSHRIVADEN
jgi:hypothetical protein